MLCIVSTNCVLNNNTSLLLPRNQPDESEDSREKDSLRPPSVERKPENERDGENEHCQADGVAAVLIDQPVHQKTEHSFSLFLAKI